MCLCVRACKLWQMYNNWSHVYHMSWGGFSAELIFHVFFFCTNEEQVHKGTMRKNCIGMPANRH